jgi:hypothetical protein
MEPAPAAPALSEHLPPGATPATVAAMAPALGPSIHCFHGFQHGIHLLIIVSIHINTLPSRILPLPPLPF